MGTGDARCREAVRRLLPGCGFLEELPVGKRRCDLVAMGDSVTACELKSDRDTLRRLEGQLEAYRKAFARTCVITCPRHADACRRLLCGSGTGLMVLDGEDWTEELPTEDREDLLEAETVFKLLRKEERSRCIREAGLELPDCDDFRWFRACLESFRTIPRHLMRELSESRLRGRLQAKREDRGLPEGRPRLAVSRSGESSGPAWLSYAPARRRR